MISAGGGFVGSTLDISNEHFMAGGDMRFTGTGGTIENLGTIRADEGDVVLMAGRIVNEGRIEAPLGFAALGAGTDILLSEGAGSRLLIQSGVETGGTGVENSGTIEAAQVEIAAAGGSVYDLAINQSGVVRATGAVSRDGRVLLTSDQGRIGVSGEVSARNEDGSGGTVHIGGGYQGQDPAILNAALLHVTRDAMIDVSAHGAGDGGTAILWSDEATLFEGRAEGRGGDAGGDGGFIEISGKRHLAFRPAEVIDLSALAPLAGLA